MRYLKSLAIILVFVVSMLFFVQNNQPLATSVVLEFNVVAAHLYSVPLPLYILVLGGFLLGALFTLAFVLVDRIRLGLELKTLRTRYAALEDETLSLRTIPLNQPENQQNSAIPTPSGPASGSGLSI